MKRTIKFRGKCIDSGKWVYGGFHTDGENYLIIHRQGNNLSQNTLVFPLSVGEFTNHTDKNGKEIYESDIYRTEVEHDFGDERTYFICVFLKEYSRFAWLSSQEYFDYQTSKDLEDLLSTEIGMDSEDSNKRLSIIGNEFDNPNLLKQ